MKKFWIIYLILGANLPQLNAQGSMKISAGSYMVAKSSPYIVLKDCDWKNDGQFTADSSTVMFSGTNSDSITGSNPTTFYNLALNKSNNGLALGQNIQVEDSLKFIAGLLSLNGFDLTLGSVNGSLIGENESSRIIGPNGGEVVKTVSLSAPSSSNPGNLGVSISSAANLGTTIIRRGHIPKNLPGGNSIERYYSIIPTNNAPSTIRMSYFNVELNGLSESILEPWHQEGINWINQYPDNSDASANYVEVAADQLGTTTLGEGALKISLKVFLQGAYTSGLMNDNLRTSGLMPLTEPYTGLGFSQVGGGAEMIDAAVLTSTGNDAIVDWMFIELRDKADKSIVLRSQDVLIQRDGDIVGLDGKSAINFAGMAEDDYYIYIYHRNHLGIQSAGPMSIARMETSHDFSSALSQAWDNPLISSNDAMVDLGSGVYGLFRSDVNLDGKVNVVDFLISKNNSTPNQSSVYAIGDVNMDGNINVVDFLITRAQSTPNKISHK